MIMRRATIFFLLLMPLTLLASTDREWRFRVYLDDREIGYHHFRLSGEDGRKTMSTEARFDVTFLSIPLFRYRHDNHEVWERNCLTRIDSVTNSNGDRTRLEGHHGINGFTIDSGAEDTSVLPGCVGSFAYWNRDLLQRDMLLNPQSGEYAKAELQYLGLNEVKSKGHNSPAHHYLLKTRAGDIELWYSDDNHWLALQSRLDGGKVLRYVIE